MWSKLSACKANFLRLSHTHIYIHTRMYIYTFHIHAHIKTHSQVCDQQSQVHETQVCYLFIYEQIHTFMNTYDQLFYANEI